MGIKSKPTHVQVILEPVLWTKYEWSDHFELLSINPGPTYVLVIRAGYGPSTGSICALVYQPKSKGSPGVILL